jgi:hypothetical protein
MVRGEQEVRLARPVDNTQFGDTKIARANFLSPDRPELPSIPAWLMLGAIREDDVPFDSGEDENTPQDEPSGPFIRVLHHFYDPYHNRPLSILGKELGTTAPTWAIEGSSGGYGTSNGFSAVMAREAMWRALTLKHQPASPAADQSLVDIAFASTTAIPDRESLRLAYWATTFRALGDVVHMLQDMAQPQHTRNDAHAGLGCKDGDCLGGHKSYYEAYVEARVKGAKNFKLTDRFFWRFIHSDTEETIAQPALELRGYPTVRLQNMGEYFSTGTGGASTLGKGLANYSNQGFYSAGTVVGNVTAGHFGSPPASLGGLAEVIIPPAEVRNAAGRQVNRGSLVLLQGPVRDSLPTGRTESQVSLASYGAFDQFLKPTLIRHATLNHYNYSEQARLLLPRAVAYSAGLLDYFFRGKLEIALPDEAVYAVRDNSAAICKDSCGFNVVKLKLTNDTPGEAMGPGVVVAVVKFHRNNCYRADLSGEPGGPNFTGGSCRNPEEEIVVSGARAVASMATGTTQTFAFDFKQHPIPINATDITLQVVFRGKLGNEDDAVAVTTRNIAEPSYVALENATDYRYSTTTQTYTPSDAPTTFASAKVTFGAATAPVAVLGEMRAPGHAQFAYLGDMATIPVKIDVNAPQISINGALTVGMPPFEFYLPPGSGSTYTSNWPVGTVRGVYRRFVYSVSRAANYEVYQCTHDFNPLACNEATLPPLTSANAVPWTIDFK